MQLTGEVCPDEAKTAKDGNSQERSNAFQSQLQALGFNEALTARISPWHNANVERVIGSVRRECIDHVIVMNERHLRRIRTSYLGNYHRFRTHLVIGKDCPEPRAVLRLHDRRISRLSGLDLDITKYAGPTAAGATGLKLDAYTCHWNAMNQFRRRETRT